MSRTRPKATHGEKQTAEASQEQAENPLYGVAMLKVAMELKRPNAPPLEEVIGGVLKKMGLSREPFEHFLQKNVGLLRTIAQRRRS